MSRILFFLVALIAVALAVLVFAPGVIPVATYKDRVETAASNAIGREVTFSDNLSFRIIPRTAFHVENLEIANADGFEGDYLARVGEADIGVKLFKLMSGSVEVDRFVLTEPDIVLVRKADGEVNWNLADRSGETEATNNNNGANNIRDIRLGDVRIVDGKARFTDAAANKTYAAEDIDLSIILNSLSEPLEADGSMVFQGEPTTVDIVLTSLADILAEEPANLKLDMKIGDTTAGADLNIITKDALSYTGPVNLNAPDLPAFASLLGTELANAPGFDNLAFSGAVEGNDKSLRLSDATINFDDINAQGVFNLNWAGAKPKASGILSTDKLDLRPYMPPPAQTPKGFPAWSEAKMDFTSLRNVDADFDISTDAIFLNSLEMGESRLKLKIDNGRMTADVPELSMYGGQGSGSFVVNARGATPSMSGALDMNTVQAQPLSLDLLKHDNLLGLGSLKFDFSASGDSQAAIMRSIDGSGGFDLANGALKGVNIAKMVRAVSEFQSGFNPAALQNAVAAARGPDEQTDFSQFLSEFNITNGLVNTPTISLTGQYLTMTGAGVINLPNQTIDLRLAPRATTTADGQGGRTATIPVRIGGTFAQPTIGIDAESLIRSGAEGTLRDLVDQIGKKDEEGEAAEGEAEEEDPAQQILRGILGGGNRDDESNDDGDSNPNGAASEEASVEEVIANEALNALFGRPKQEETPAEDPDQ